jgi:hypothetical protein
MYRTTIRHFNKNFVIYDYTSVLLLGHKSSAMFQSRAVELQTMGRAAVKNIVENYKHFQNCSERQQLFAALRNHVIKKIGIVGGGVRLAPLGNVATNRPIVPAPGDYDDGEISGMIGRGNRSTWRITAPVPLCPPQTPHAARMRTQAAAVGSQRLTA